MNIEVMRPNASLICLLLAACNDAVDGEPIAGDISIHYGSSSPSLEVGAAVTANTAGDMLVQIGTDHVDCDTSFDDDSFDNPKGTFVYFTVPMTTPGTYANESIDVRKSTGSSISINGANGAVTIESIDTRVTGTIAFTTTDDDVGTISVQGSFDVVRCW